MKKKVLVVDDDAFARKILKQFLRNFPCTVTEAENGVEALTCIAQDPPDMVLLDVEMPVLDGLATLQEIRASSSFRHLQVVSVSGNSDRATVMKLIDLGISGFLLKPLRPDDTIRRLDVLFQRLKKPTTERIQLVGAAAANKERLLLVDHDLNFREFVRPLLETHFEVREAATGAAGLQAFMEQDPRIVCIAEKLELLSTERLVQMIRDVHFRVTPQIYLLSESGEVPATLAPLVNGAIRKSFVPDDFDQELRTTIFAHSSPATMIRTVVQNSLLPEIVTATRQTIGVMTSQDVSVLDDGEHAPDAASVHANVSLVGLEEEVTVSVGLIISEEDAVRIGEKILGAPTPLDEGSRDAVAELAATIAGRVCASLAAHGYRLQQQAPQLADTASLVASCHAVTAFQTADKEEFLVAVWVRDGHIGEPWAQSNAAA